MDIAKVVRKLEECGYTERCRDNKSIYFTKGHIGWNARIFFLHLPKTHEAFYHLRLQAQQGLSTEFIHITSEDASPGDTIKIFEDISTCRGLVHHLNSTGPRLKLVSYHDGVITAKEEAHPSRTLRITGNEAVWIDTDLT